VHREAHLKTQFTAERALVRFELPFRFELPLRPFAPSFASFSAAGSGSESSEIGPWGTLRERFALPECPARGRFELAFRFEVPFRRFAPSFASFPSSSSCFKPKKQLLVPSSFATFSIVSKVRSTIFSAAASSNPSHFLFCRSRSSSFRRAWCVTSALATLACIQFWRRVEEGADHALDVVVQLSPA
jgi:hypothetical protein